MARYIDADKLIKELGDCTLDTWGKGLGASWWAQSVKLKDNMVECINKQPTADVVEVVRCKDCIHKLELNEYEKKVYQEGCVACTYIHTMSERLVMLSNNFCGYGERRTE